MPHFFKNSSNATKAGLGGWVIISWRVYLGQVAGRRGRGKLGLNKVDLSMPKMRLKEANFEFLEISRVGQNMHLQKGRTFCQRAVWKNLDTPMAPDYGRGSLERNRAGANRDRDLSLKQVLALF